MQNTDIFYSSPGLYRFVGTQIGDYIMNYYHDIAEESEVDKHCNHIAKNGWEKTCRTCQQSGKFKILEGKTK